MKNVKPCYSLSGETIFCLSAAAWLRIREAARDYFLVTGDDRAKHRDYLRKWIAAYRQLEGYRIGKCYTAAHRSVTRGMTKKHRRWYRQYQQEKRKKESAKP